MPVPLQYPFTVIHMSGNSKQRRKYRRKFARSFKDLKAKNLLEGKETINHYWTIFTEPSYQYEEFK